MWKDIHGLLWILSNNIVVVSCGSCGTAFSRSIRHLKWIWTSMSHWITMRKLRNDEMCFGFFMLLIVFWSPRASEFSWGSHLHAEFFTLTKTTAYWVQILPKLQWFLFWNQCGTNRLQKGASAFVFQMEMEPQGGRPSSLVINGTFKKHLAWKKPYYVCIRRLFVIEMWFHAALKVLMWPSALPV